MRLRWNGYRRKGKKPRDKWGSPEKGKKLGDYPISVWVWNIEKKGLEEEPGISFLIVNTYSAISYFSANYPEK